MGEMPMQYHHITVSIRSSHAPPYFTGSMLRGAFGHALKHVTCINPSYQCRGCFQADTCLYYRLFERENIYHPYRFDVTLGSPRWDFGLYLFGDACRHLPYFLSALEKTLRHSGLGKDRLKFEDFEIAVNGTKVYQNGAFSTQIDVTPQPFAPGPCYPDVRVRLLTPLRIKRANALEYDTIRIEHLLRSIYQREQSICHGRTVHTLGYTPQLNAQVKALYYKPLYRRSDRQNRSITIDGVLGELAVLGLDRRSCELLKAGKILGAGKQTVFGLGKIKIEEAT